jgi:hypothetical protein
MEYFGEFLSARKRAQARAPRRNTRGSQTDHALDDPDLYEWDPESWHANISGMYGLLESLHNLAPDSCVILSGDVHFGSAYRAIFSDTGGRQTVFLQFTSSALKNGITWSVDRLAAAVAPSVKEVLYWKVKPNFRRDARHFPEEPTLQEELENLEIAQIAHGGPGPLLLTETTALRFWKVDRSADYRTAIMNLGGASLGNKVWHESNLGYLRLARQGPVILEFLTGTADRMSRDRIAVPLPV